MLDVFISQCDFGLCVCSGAGGNVQQSGGNVHLPAEQAGAQAMGSGSLPLPQAPWALADGPQGQAVLLLLLAQKGSPSLLLACSLLLPAGIIMHWSNVYLCELLLQLMCPWNFMRTASKTA